MSLNKKIFKSATSAAPTELTIQVAQAIQDLENHSADLKADLRVLQIAAAKEIEIGSGRKAIVVFVPVPLLKAFHKIQTRLVRELEKKFSDRHVLIVAQRKIMPKPTRKSRVKQQRPRSRTLTTVHENLLEDLVFPTEIVGKRTKVKVDGSKTIKVFLDAKDRNSLENKLDTFSAVYKKVTGKDVVFDFPIQAQD
jgi:small subunit ribosomal protein S7e